MNLTDYLASVPVAIVAALVVFVVLFSVMGLKIVQQSETMVIERLGRYHRTLSSGVNIIWPIFDKPRSIEWKYVKMDVDGRTIVRKAIITRLDLRTGTSKKSPSNCSSAPAGRVGNERRPA